VSAVKNTPIVATVSEHVPIQTKLATPTV